MDALLDFLNWVRLTLGGFMTSAGFGGLMAGLGVLVAVQKNINERRTVHDSAERERWWKTFDWVDKNIDELDPDTFTGVFQELLDASTVQGQRAILEGLMANYQAHTVTRAEARREAAQHRQEQQSALRRRLRREPR